MRKWESELNGQRYELISIHPTGWGWMNADGKSGLLSIVHAQDAKQRTAIHRTREYALVAILQTYPQTRLIELD